MAKKKLRGKDLQKLGFGSGPPVTLALEMVKKHFKNHTTDEIFEILSDLVANPKDYLKDNRFVKVAKALLPEEEIKKEKAMLNPAAKAFPVFGKDQIEEPALEQMQIAMRLPITEAGALMPDAHQGYGLPIGGVLATENAIIPYGVGMDIGCRMCLSIYDLPANKLERDSYKFKKALGEHTRFGKDAFEQPLDHSIFSRSEFKEIRKVKQLRDKAWKQIGSSGSGNHFVEFGLVTITNYSEDLQLELGQYLAVLSHSGSRGLGANIAQHYTNLARAARDLPKQAQALAWLDLDSEAGQEYWLAMNLAGDYASACHEQIHHRLGQFLGIAPLVKVENHHNFAWKQTINGKEYIVHRKGATPAAQGELGVIPGSMTAPAFIVRGKGNPDALYSAAHGAGRRMSRRKAKESFTKSEMKKFLHTTEVELLGGGLDESPFAYKDIHTVMKNQSDLVDTIGTFHPKIVRMDKA